MKKNKLFLIALLAFTTVFSSCELAKDDEGDGKSSNTTTYVNKLTLGRGFSGFTLTNESSWFSHNDAQIYYRLETVADIKDYTIRLKIKKSGITDIVHNTTPAQNYGHITISSFPPPPVASGYTVEGYLVKINEETLVASTALNIE